MESTKQMLVRKSSNLFLPFSSETQYAIGKDIAFSSDPTLFATIMSDGNIHIHGTKSVEDSGYILIGGLTQKLILKAGSTYNLSISATSPVQCIIQSDQSGTRTNIMQVNPTFTNGLTKTMTEDTVITHVFMNISGATLINTGDTVDEYVNPMLVEQSTRMDYEPYYKEYESTKEVLVRRSNNLLNEQASVVNGYGGGYEKGAPLLPLTIPTTNTAVSRHIAFKIDAGTYTITTSVGDGTKVENVFDIILCTGFDASSELQHLNSGSKNSLNSTSTFTVTEEIASQTKYLRLFYNGYASEKLGGQPINYIMLNKGTDALPYEPYYKEYEATSMQINDFYPTGYVVNSKGVAVMNLVDFSNAVYNQFLLESGNTFSNGVWAYTPDYAQCEGNAQYYIGCLDLIPNNNTLRQYSIYFYDENKQIIPNSATGAWGHTNQDFKVEKTSPSNAKYMRIRFDRFGDKAENPYPKFLYVYKDPTA